MKRGPRRSALAAALVCFAGLMLVLYLFFSQRSHEENLQMEYIARTVEAETYETLLYQMQKTRILEAYLIETGGTYDTFAPIAEGLIHEKGVRSVIFAPDSVVEGVFPLEGNEAVIGLDLTREGLGNLEARAAIEKGELFMAGPFEMVEGGPGICGRLPVYLTNDSGERTYWGLVTVTLDYPDIFVNSPIQHVNEQGCACRVWRINPDDGLDQTILETERPIPANVPIMERTLSMFNSQWTIWVAPLTPWYARGSTWLALAAAILISLLTGFAAYTLARMWEQRRVKSVQQISTLQRQLEQEQSNMLLSQINSHFFYHTLNALQALIILKPDAAYKMAGDFARYLRFNIDTVGEKGGLVSFREELRAVRAYVDINIQQLGDRLKVVYDLADADFQIPALTVQPIVENAILHGIKPKVGGGTVTIALAEEETHWRVTVSDDGVGFDPAADHTQKAVGLTNLRRRIARFPDCRLEIGSIPRKGTSAVLLIRKNLEPL